MLISVPPKFSVSQVVGYIKGKSAIHIARRFINRGRNFTGCSFWARGYFVSTVGRDEKIIRAYIKKSRICRPIARSSVIFTRLTTALSGSFKPPALPEVMTPYGNLSAYPVPIPRGTFTAHTSIFPGIDQASK